jgi:hypothetical protein
LRVADSLTTDLRPPRGWLTRGGVGRSARAGVGAVGSASLLATLLLAMPAGAVAATPPSATETFKSTGSEQTFTVPAGVTSVHVQAIGAAGGQGQVLGSAENASSGGLGAVVGGELAVTPGEVLYVEVAGSNFNGGAGGATSDGYGAGAGGGASDLRTISSGGDASAEESLDSRVLVAGGGGGGGTALWGAGGRGGDAGGPGGEGVSGSERYGPYEYDFGSPVAVGVGGGAGTLTGPGEVTTSCGYGQNGLLGDGGAGGEGYDPYAAGGGGGGGYYGGAGGSGSCTDFGPEQEEGAGGGGGGGSSYVGEDIASASFGLDSAATEPAVTISYDTPATATPEASTISFPGVQPQGTVSAPQTVTLTNTGGTPLELSAETFDDSSPALASDHPEDFLVGSSSCSGEIAFEQTCQLTVRFAPQEAGTSTATLQIDGNIGAGSTTIALSGTGGSLPQGASGKDVQGPAGPAGPQGERGPAGPAAVYECHPREGHGKFATACFVRIMPGSPSVLKATLKRGGLIYATGPVAGGAKHGKGLTLRATRVVTAGRYRLVLRSRDGLSTSRYVTVK